jgi:hypothetical protein
MSVYVRNLTINTGTDFSETLELTQSGGGAVNLNGFNGVAHLRKNPESTNYVGFGISFVNRSGGVINISMGSTITSTIKAGRYVYDLLLIRPNTTKTVAVEGTVLVRAGISTRCF